MSSTKKPVTQLPTSPMFAEVHEPTTSVPFENRVAWTIRLKDYITVAFYRYRFLWAILMAVVAVVASYITNGDALGWLQHNSVVALVFAGCVFFIQRHFFPQRNVYCIDHCEFIPPESWRVSREQIINIFSTDKNFTIDSLDFMRRLLVNSGTSDHTAFPPNMIKSLKDGQRWSSTLADSRFEGETTMSGALQGLMDKTGITAKDIAAGDCCGGCCLPWPFHQLWRPEPLTPSRQRQREHRRNWVDQALPRTATNPDKDGQLNDDVCRYTSLTIELAAKAATCGLHHGLAASIAAACS